MDKKCVIGRHIDGITLNDYEYVLGEDDEIRVFENKSEAIAFLKEQNVADDELESLKFFDYEMVINGRYEEVA